MADKKMCIVNQKISFLYKGIGLHLTDVLEYTSILSALKSIPVTQRMSSLDEKMSQKIGVHFEYVIIEYPRFALHR